jgi:hypothetical protein
MPNKSKVLKMFSQGVTTPPDHVIKGLQYETIMGSLSYGVSTDNSDQDIYGFSIPYKTMIFPHLQGYIMDFGPRPQGFDQWQQHHVKSPCGKIIYDFNIFGIVRFFNLCMNSNLCREASREPFLEPCPTCKGEMYFKIKGRNVQICCSNCEYFFFDAETIDYHHEAGRKFWSASLWNDKAKKAQIENTKKGE